MKRPNPLIYIFFGFLLRVFAKLKGQKIVRLANIERPSIVLGNHGSWYDFIYMISALYPKRITFVAADKFFYDPLLKIFMGMDRAIQKSLFQSDPIATMKIYRTLKKSKGIVGIYPEGQISPIGKFAPFNEAIGKLAKKANVPVYMTKHVGAYFINPPWSKKTFKGKMETVVDLIVSTEDMKTMTEDEINQKIREKLYFNSAEYNETAKRQYRLNDVDNLESVVYQCPVCKAEHMTSVKTGLQCPDCKRTYDYDVYGKIGGYRIDELYDMQAAYVKDLFDKNPDFTLHADVELESYRNKRLAVVGEGTLKLSKAGYLFEGIVDHEFRTFTFNPKRIPTLAGDLGINVQIYEGYQIYEFVFSDKHIPSKFALAAEYLYAEANKEA